MSKTSLHCTITVSSYQSLHLQSQPVATKTASGDDDPEPCCGGISETGRGPGMCCRVAGRNWALDHGKEEMRKEATTITQRPPALRLRGVVSF